MATGDSDDMLARLRSLIPGGWFSRTTAPIRNVVFGGLADSLAWVYSLLSTVRLFTRVKTTTGWFLDLVAWDFFGPDFLRRSGENDDNWRTRFVAEIFRERVTRKGIVQALYDLTGRQPKLFEPWNPNDCGAIGIGTIALAGQGFAPSNASALGIAASGGLGEGHLHLGMPLAPTGNSFAGAGCIGSLALPYQVFITAYRPVGLGIPNVTGLGYGGIGTGDLEITDASQIEAGVTDAEIYATVAANAAAGVTPWTAIES